MLTRDQIVENINALEQQGASQQDIQGWLNSLKGQNVGGSNIQTLSTTQPDNTVTNSILSTNAQGERVRNFSTGYGIGGDIVDAGIGFAKGAASTIASVPKAISTIVESTAKIAQSKAIEDGIRQIGSIADRQAQVFQNLPEDDPRRETAKAALISAATQIDMLAKQNPDSNDSATAKMFEFLNPTNTAQKVGFGAEKLSEAVAMGQGGFNQARSALSASSIEGVSSSKLVNAAINMAGYVAKTTAKGVVSGAESALLTAAQGGKPEDIKKAAKLGFGIQVSTDVLSSIVNKSGSYLINKAQKMYQSYLKPSTSLGVEWANKVVKTGLAEGIVLSENGLRKTADKIDDLERQLGDVISQAGSDGGTVEVSKLKDYVDEVKVMVNNITDRAYAKKATEDIDAIYNNFTKEFGDTLPVARAQEIKVATYQWLKDAFGELSSPVKEANKQLARGLKEGILDAAPSVGPINEKLSRLYEFDKALEKASVRLKNKDVLSLGTKVIAAPLAASGKGLTAATIGFIHELFTGNPAIGSFTAIQLNKLGKILETLNPEEKQVLINAYPAIKQLIIGGTIGTLTKSK